MPRMRRTVVPDYPHHILQRGHNGQEVFKDEEDYLKYLADLRELKEKWHVKVYGWCLLPEQVHMLVDPGPNPDMLSELMKALAARTTRHRNRRDKRSGTLWVVEHFNHRRSQIVGRKEIHQHAVLTVTDDLSHRSRVGSHHSTTTTHRLQQAPAHHEGIGEINVTSGELQ